MDHWKREEEIQEILLLLQIRIKSVQLREINQELTINKRLYSLEIINSIIDKKRIQLKELNDLLSSQKNKFESLKKESESLKSAIDENRERFLITGKIIHDYELNTIKSMNGFEFEKYIAYLFKFLGYKNIFRTQDSNDQGIDVIAEKNNFKYGIQCKLYSTAVGNAAIQQAIAGKAFYKLDEAIVITNNFFTDSAKVLAVGTDTKLINKLKLDELIYKVACYGNYVPYGYNSKKVEVKISNK